MYLVNKERERLAVTREQGKGMVGVTRGQSMRMLSIAREYWNLMVGCVYGTIKGDGGVWLCNKAVDHECGQWTKKTV